ncbi:MAG: PstS family phosphate ABC transporter substrate-binding protein [Candidatus Eiseniibacteriota bacterium]
MDFVARDGGGGRSPRAGLLAIWVLGALLAGCSPHSSKPAVVEDSLTSGRITLVCAWEARAVIERERDAFQSLYPQVQIEIQAGTSREAIGRLFGGTADVAVIARELAPEERAAAQRGRLELEGYRFAHDALLAVVHPSVGVENLTLADLESIYAGRAQRWSEFGGDGTRIVPVVQPQESDVTQCFVQRVMPGGAIAARSVEATSDSEVVAEVSARPGAIGYVSLGAALGNLHALRLASLRGLPYRDADLERVYRGEYPLTRFFNLYVRASSRPAANGFITYITSIDGQKLVQQSGYVPTAVPVRFVRRSPLRGTH